MKGVHAVYLSKDLMVYGAGVENCVNVYNKHTNKLCRLHKRLYEHLLSLDRSGKMSDIIADLSESQQKVLFDNNVVYESEAEYSKAKYARGYRRADKKLEMVYIHLTMDCNLACTYCYHGIAKSGGPQMSLEDAVRVFSSLKSAGVKSLVFTGGEPLMCRDFLEIIRQAKNLGFHVTVNTNGTLIGMQTLQDMYGYLDCMIVSLDSIESEDRIGADPKEILTNVLSAKNGNAGNKIEVRSVLMKGKESETEFLGKILASSGIRHIKVLCLPNCKSDIDKLPDHNALDFSQAGDTSSGCGADNGVIALDPEGNIFPCQTLVKPELKIASIFDDDWHGKFLRSDLCHKINSFMVENHAECLACDVGNFCGGGCRAVAYNVYGDFAARMDFLCGYLKANGIGRLLNVAK